MDRVDWQASVHGITKELDRTKELNNNKIKIMNYNFQLQFKANTL